MMFDSMMQPDFSGRLEPAEEWEEEPFNYEERRTDLALERDPVPLRETVSFRETLAILEEYDLKKYFPQRLIRMEGKPILMERPSLTRGCYSRNLEYVM